MKKAKFWPIAGILLAALLIMTGCSGGSTSGVTPETPVPVIGVSVADAAGQKSSTLWINVGENPNHLLTSVTLTATVAPDNATDQSVTWSSSSTATVAALSSTSGATITVTAGTVTGTAVITVSTADGNKTDTYTVEVKNAGDYVAVEGVEIQHNGQTITELEFNKVGNNFDGAKQLDLEYTPSDGTPVKVEWSVDPEGVVTVANGLVTPVGLGDATITVTVDDEFTASVEVTVKEVDLGDFDPVESVSVTPGTALSFSKTGNDPFEPASVTLEALVSPAGAYDGVTWESNDQTVATVSEGVVTPVGAGTAKIYAISVGEDSSGVTVKSNEVNVTVTVESAQSAALVLYNQVNVGAETTTDLEVAWNDTTKKYTIKNVDGGIAAGESPDSTGGVTKATIVYWNTPLAGTAQSISARVRLKSGTTGVLMGLMTDPTGDIRFQGIRATTNAALWRAYHSRTNTNSSTALTVQNNSGYGERTYQNPGSSSNQYASQIDSTDIPFDEEFILEYERTGAAAYTVRLKSYSGVLIASLSSTGATFNTGVEYPGFIVAGAEVEISQITIKNGGTEVFLTAASTPTPTTITGVEFTAPVSGPGPYSAYTHSIANNNNSLALAAKALPARAPQDITWAITGTGASLSANSGTDVTATLTTEGSVSVTATAGTESATLPINVEADAIDVETITISAEDNATSIMVAGSGNNPPAEKLLFTADIQPTNATDKTVSWSVHGDALGTTTTTYATIGSSTGLLEAVAPGDVWVFATATDGTDVKSNGVKITVKPYSAAPSYTLVRAGEIGSGNNRGEVTSVTFASDTLVLTGAGRFTSGSNGGAAFIYTPISASIFTSMEVDMVGATATDASNSLAGLWIIDTDPATTPASYGLIFGGHSPRISDSSRLRLVHASKASGNSAATRTVATTNFSNVPSTANPWKIKIERDGSSIKLTITQGTTSDTITYATTTIPAAIDGTGTLYIGLAVADDATSSRATGTAQFKNFKINGEIVPLNQAQILD